MADDIDPMITDDDQPAINVNPAVTTMSHMMNYLTGSLYQGQFTYSHEQAWARLNVIYDRISRAPSIAPSLENIKEFHDDVASLWFVTETDDPDYDIYIKQLRRQIAAAAEALQLKEDEEERRQIEEAKQIT